jgi:transcription elongation factor GreA
MESIPISVQGLEKVHQELEELKKERPLVVQAIKEAREEGDLRENAGYDAAKERQGMLEAKINYLESRIPFYTVIDMDTLGGDVITFGATVTLEDLDTGEEKTYTLMGPDESDVNKGIISVLSPVGQALLGKEEGDEILVEAPRGRIEYEIISVTFKRSTPQ